MSTNTRGLNKFSGKASGRDQGSFKVNKITKKKGSAAKKPARFYPADDVPFPLRSARVDRAARRGPKTRASIAPGVVCILLTGQATMGKRVIVLKVLPSGLLVVTGPFQVNGVPVRRVNPAYVIATSTSVDVSKVNASKFNDDYFGRKETASKDGEDGFFDAATSKAVVSDERKADQKAVDAAIKLSDDMKAYLASRFSLKSGDRPHEMVF
jgi:large subunit ribosomal protein L6e